MTADSTISSSGTEPRNREFSTVSVMPPRGAVPRPPSSADGRRGRSASPMPLLVADGTAALLGALTLIGTQLHPLPSALLLGASLLLRPRHARPSEPGVLDELPAVCRRTAVAWLAFAALVAAYRPDDALSTRTLLLGFTVQAATSCALRGTVHARRRAALARDPRTALVIGPAATAQRVAAAVLRHPWCGVRPVGIVAERQNDAGGLPVLATGHEVERAVVQNGVQAVLAVHPSVRTQQQPLLSALAERGCVVWELDADSPSYATKDRLAGFSCRRLERASTPRGSAGKRALDILVSTLLLLLVSPLLLVCAVTLRISDGPGVLFRQERIGKDGKPFTLLKFRTHRPLDEHEAATRWSVANEHEMRGFCRMLRRTSLDELPQLWNVLRGDMSLVGPRPERPYFVAEFSESHPGYAARHRVRTGITGLAQIHGLRGDTSIEDRFRFDNVYIDNWSLWQDVSILLRTVGTLMRPTGS
ncbi:exopolysaccharide biosynthesis polyprenyl glycosylphosphotransferase [Streptomyces akebiae]|uniref:Exopolysaccharide biosynthesis polyprenyl glycosylphosphotransferase n=1 Tax=Streptomyces akebiae TaxID=2865673 RepID=A0ABX8XVK1_9ACTN|nr:exopolysaccharide biosynthesis polyprenyl glycosylphosphotransferase [Streptomyces akebiae]QYX79961.1 exopolysaccharide biosynthesis polyprenyl glycosylphosphotransferase [Streptomyces akebiae]